MTYLEDWEINKNYSEPHSRLTWIEFIDGLPNTLPEAIDLWIIGGLTRNGFTEHDIDFYMENPDWNAVKIYEHGLVQMAREIFGKQSHLGNYIFKLNPRPIPIKIYENGRILDREMLKSLVEIRQEKIPLVPDWRKELIDRIEALENRNI